jgi:hypothetical protein
MVKNALAASVVGAPNAIGCAIERQREGCDDLSACHQHLSAIRHASVQWQSDRACGQCASRLQDHPLLFADRRWHCHVEASAWNVQVCGHSWCRECSLEVLQQCADRHFPSIAIVLVVDRNLVCTRDLADA